jgi:hypothetical protein
MRTAILSAMLLCLGAGIAGAEIPAAPRPGGAARPMADEASKRVAHERAVAECEGMWDRGTHMTKQEWSQTCRRVQDRLKLLEIR